MKVIAISGKAQHGKTTVANYLKSYLEAFDYRVLVINYADLLKFICKTYFGWNGEKDEYGRSLLQYVGTEIIRAQYPTFFVDTVGIILSLFQNEWDYVIIADVRFPNEISQLTDTFEFDCKHLRVIRPNYESSLDEHQKCHISETALDLIEPDTYLYNSGTLEDLAVIADEWLTEYLKDNMVEKPIVQ